MSLLSMENVTGGYGEADILHSVSLQVNPKEIVVIVGPNGAGKSTAMKAVFGLLRLRSGRIQFDGQDITNWKPDRVVRRGICFVPQTDNVFPSLSVRKISRWAPLCATTISGLQWNAFSNFSRPFARKGGRRQGRFPEGNVRWSQWAER